MGRPQQAAARGFARTLAAAGWVAGACVFAAPAGASGNDAVLAELKRLSARIEQLERRNQALEAQLESSLAQSQAAARRNEDRVRQLEETADRTERALATERLSEKEPELVTRLKAVEYQALSMQKQARQIESLEGISVSAALTSVIQQVNGDGSADGTRAARLNYRGDVTVSLPGGEIGQGSGRMFAHVRMGQGEGVALRPTYISTVNSTAFQTAASQPDDSFAVLAQAWYQFDLPLPVGGYKPHSRQRLEVNVGKMDPFLFFDQNAAADDESLRFLNNAFVHNPLLDSGGDVGADAYGFSPGLRVAYFDEQSKPEGWGLSLGVFAAKQGANFSGSPGRAFVIGQAERAQRLFGGLAGNYRLYVWRNAGATDYDGRAHAHSGLGVSIDQRVGDAWTVFGRYGHQLSGRVRFDRALTVGAEWGGQPWGRSADALGLALGALRTSAAFSRDAATVDADSDGVPDYGDGARGSERILELYYRYRLGRQLELSPDIQVIQHPGANAAARAVHAVGLRMRASF